MLRRTWKYRQLVYLHYIEIPACRAFHAMGLVSADQVAGLVERWEELNRKATLAIIQEKWK
jgi:hypothetical protein